MSTPIKQETNNKYGRLTVIAFAGQAAGGYALWECKCICGKHTTVYGSNLRRGHTTSCGCHLLERITKHGAARRTQHFPEYNIYQAAKERCNNPNDRGYVNYGGRGIKFVFESFEQFYQEMGPRPSSVYSLDRQDNNGDYAPGNVHWATRKEQNENRRKCLRIEQWSDEDLLTECRRRELLL